MKILVMGSVALDSVKAPTGSVRDTVGGSAFYFAHGARPFASTAVVSIVGKDFPQSEFQDMDALGIDRTGLAVGEGDTFRWEGRYLQDMNVRETIKTELNVLEEFVPFVPEHLRKAKIVFLANMEPETQLAVLDQMKRPWLTACDTMNLWIEHHRDRLLELLGRVDLFFLNDEEARMLTGKNSLVAAGKAVRELGPQWVVLKRGEHGSMLFGGGNPFVLSAFPTTSVQDPTGAGDSFAGGCLGYLAWRGSDSEESLRASLAVGGVVASFTVEEFGANRLKGLTLEEIAGRAKAFAEMTSFAVDWYSLQEGIGKGSS